MMPFVRALLAIVLVAVVVAGLYAWRDNRVYEVLQGAEAGDVLAVSTDICNELLDRDLISGATDCGYRDDDVSVRLVRDP